MGFKIFKKYFLRKTAQDNSKIQSKQMEKSIVRSKDISKAYLQGGKAVGDIVKSKKKN